MSGETTIHRYEVPVDDEPHVIACGPPLYVAGRTFDRGDAIEFWAYPDGSNAWQRAFIVVGTGHPLPPGNPVHRGSVIVANGALVWHLLEVDP